MADTRVFDPTKDTACVRRKVNGAWETWTQNSADEHNVGGFSSTGNSQHISLLNFDFSNVADFKQLLKAELHVFTTDDHPGFKTQKTSLGLNLRMATLKHPWTPASGGSEGDWSAGIPDNIINEPSATFRSYGKVSDIPLHENIIDVTAMVRAVLPDSITDPQGKACLGLANLGWHMTVAGDATQQKENEWCVASKDHSNTAIRPFVVLTFEPKGGPGLTVLTAPDGDVASGTDVFLQGEYEPGRVGDIIKRVTIEVTDPATGVVVWTAIRTVGNTEVETSTFTFKVVLGKLKSETPYEWTARIENQRGEWTPWATPKADIRYRGTIPTLASPAPTGTHESLLGVPFRAIYTSATQRAALWQVQLRTQLVSTDPTWTDDLIWDSGQVTVPARQSAGGPVTETLSMSYGGPLLAPGTYSFRMQARDRFNAETDWLYGQVTVTAPYVTQPGGNSNALTAYVRPDPFRIRIFGMGANRGPGTLLADLTDASNVGASEYYNAGGEFYFTLPARHPQVTVIEPYQTHYALELHTSEGWRGKAYGIITDFDATEDEVVFYGMDYAAVLGRLIEERFDPTNAELPADKGGAKYENKTIDYVIKDQLTKSRTTPNSPLAFITLGDVVAMPEKVTIYASFKQRLPFIAGLIDSYRAGTGRKTRIVCERDVNGAFKWRVLNDPGINRDNLRMEYGGLIQGFRTVPFSGWGTAVNAMGRTVLGTKVYADRAAAKSNDPVTGDPINIESLYGAWPSTAMYADLDDINDLRRRTAQAAAQVAKVGKLMGIGIRVGGLNIKDGWDICDSVPILIKQGVVDTTRFGSGYWTIWGWSWQSYPDGHYDLNLTLAPRQDLEGADSDLIPSVPILDEPDWDAIDHGASGSGGVPVGGVPVVTTAELNVPHGTVTTSIVTTGGGGAGNNPGYANDANNETISTRDSYVMNTGTHIWYWKSDLGAPYEVTSMKVYSPRGTYDWEGGALIEGSADGVSWTPIVQTETLGSYAGYIGPVPIYIYTFASPQTYRYWRISIRRTVGGLTYTGYISMSEWQIFGGDVSGGASWTAPAGGVSDGDDGTYDTITGKSLLRLALADQQNIVRTHIRIAGTLAGARTFTIKGSVNADYSGLVTLATINWTAIGSLTAQDVDAEWVTSAKYRYFELTVDDSDTYRVYAWELFKPTPVATNHEHPLPDLDDLPDVNAPVPTDGQVLTWDSTPGEWVARTPAPSGMVSPMTTPGDIIYAPNTSHMESWPTPTGNVQLQNAAGPIAEFVVATVQFPGSGWTSLAVDWDFWHSLNRPGYTKNGICRVRRDGLGGAVVASQAFGPYSSDTSSGHAVQWDSNYNDVAPTTGKYVLTYEFTSDTSGQVTQLWSDTRLFTVSGVLAAGASARLGIGAAGTVLTSVAGLPAWAAAAAGATNLNALTDVDTATVPPTAGQALVYDTGSSLWKPGTVAAGGGGGGAGGATGFIGCHLVLNALTFSIPNGAFTPIGFDGELFDSDGFHDNVTNNTRVTIPAGMGGKYLCIGQTEWDANTTNERIITFSINGAAQRGWDRKNIPNAQGQSSNLTTVVDLAAGDYVQLHAYQTSGSTRTVQGGSGRTLLQVVKLDSGKVGAGIGVKARATGTQTLTNGTYPVTVAFAAADIFDTDGFHNIATNNDRVVIPAGLGGKYLVAYEVQYGNNATGERFTHLSVNGAGEYGAVRAGANATFETRINGSTVLDLVAGDYVTLTAYQQNSGGSTLTLGANTFLSVMRLDSGGASGASGATTLDALTDVDTATVPPTAGQALVYDTAVSLWKPGTVAAGGGGGSASLGSDTFIGDGVLTAFTLTAAPGGGKAVVTINGAQVLPSTYTIVGTTLTFTTAPANLDEVVATYALGSGGGGGGAAPTPFDLTVTHNTYLSQEHGNTVLSGVEVRLAEASGYFKFPMLRFDLSSLAGKKVVNARLRLQAMGDGSIGYNGSVFTGFIGVKRNLRAVNFAVVNWNIYDTGQNWAGNGWNGADAGGGAEAITAWMYNSNEAGLSILLIDMTASLQERIDAGATSVIYVLRASTTTGGGGNAVVFYGINAGTATLRPRLIGSVL